jgi:hypothetical protein
MTLPEPRQGKSFGFQIHPDASYEGTLGSPEKIIWSSIRYLCARDVVDPLLYSVHSVKRANVRSKIARNIKLYVTQAYDFYEAARSAESDTAPLLYYYSFLNLAKSICEIHRPAFHRTPESYRHGLSWKPSRHYLVNMETESLTVGTRGVWHVLLESITGHTKRISNPLKLKIKDLFALCPETGIEYQRAYHESNRLIDLKDPYILVDMDKNEVWIRFGIQKKELKELRLSRKRLLNLIKLPSGGYKQVRSDDNQLWLFELEKAKKCKPEGMEITFQPIKPEIDAMNLFAHLAFDKMYYSIPIQTRLPIRMPQLVVLYTLVFWLSSLVRYDPHSVISLQDSKFWVLIDGFMNQSRIWLLELFEWHLYKTETVLRYVR